MKNKNRQGFTLIEILIVVTIIGLLSSVVIVGLAPAQRRGRDARRLSDLKQVQSALELYYNKCGRYPGDSACAGTNPSDWGGLTTALKGANIGVNQVPNEPLSSKSYEYFTDTAGLSYVLKTTLEDKDNPALKQTVQVPDGVTVTCDTTKLEYCMVF